MYRRDREPVQKQMPLKLQGEMDIEYLGSQVGMFTAVSGAAI
jgi:hypothetical protein